MCFQEYVYRIIVTADNERSKQYIGLAPTTFKAKKSKLIL